MRYRALLNIKTTKASAEILSVKATANTQRVIPSAQIKKEYNSKNRIVQENILMNDAYILAFTKNVHEGINVEDYHMIQFIKNVIDKISTKEDLNFKLNNTNLAVFSFSKVINDSAFNIVPL